MYEEEIYLVAEDGTSMNSVEFSRLINQSE